MANGSEGFRNPTDEVDLNAALHNLGGTVEGEDELGDEADEVDQFDQNVDQEKDIEEPNSETPDQGEVTDDLPQVITESYGTGVQTLPGYTIGGRTMADRRRELHEATPELTGGDIDADYEQANAVGDEAVGGTVSTPDMDIVDDLGRAVGLEMDDRAFLRTEDILTERDDRRWELDPSSSEDYSERRDED